MKKIFLLMLQAIMLYSIVSTSFATGSIYEKPKLGFCVETNMTTFAQVPIIQNDRALLPIRELLNKLGVPNDNQHIAWNAAEKSVTINTAINGSQRSIYLKVGNKTAYVDGKSTEIDVAPIIYQDRTYIPLRFVSESLDKKVLWLEASELIFIRDLQKFNQAKASVTKIFDAMQSEKYITINLQNEVVDEMTFAYGDNETKNTTRLKSEAINYNRENDLLYSKYESNSVSKVGEKEISLETSLETYNDNKNVYNKMSIISDNPDLMASENGEWTKSPSINGFTSRDELIRTFTIGYLHTLILSLRMMEDNQNISDTDIGAVLTEVNLDNDVGELRVVLNSSEIENNEVSTYYFDKNSYRILRVESSKTRLSALNNVSPVAIYQYEYPKEGIILPKEVESAKNIENGYIPILNEVK